MKLYHGSNISIEKIDLTKSKVGKDFGKGFYLSADREQAEKMATIKTVQMDSGSPIVTEFDFDERLLTDGSLRVKVNQDIQFLIECIAKDIVLLMIHDYQMSMQEALNEFYNSDTFKKLEDPNTGLYYQSSLYIYSFLQTELKTGSIQEGSILLPKE